MLIRPETFAAIKAGTIDTQFRRWSRPTVKTGGTLTNEWGVFAIDAVEPVELADITDDDLRRWGTAPAPSSNPTSRRKVSFIACASTTPARTRASLCANPCPTSPSWPCWQRS